MKPLAIVIPWFGSDLKGGAEQLARQMAVRLAARGNTIEVLTSCCRSFHEDWGTNHLRAGVSHEHGLLIRRFPVTYRDHGAFDQINTLMLNIPHSQLKPGVNPVSQIESAAFLKENINSADLLNYLERNREMYQAFIFLPYLYGLIINGLPLVSDRAFLQPCLHDEAYAYLPEIERLFHKTKGILFNSEGELRLASKLYGPGILHKSTIVGVGVEVDLGAEKNIVKVGPLKMGDVRYVLCLGRRDPTKNTDLLVRSYGIFKEKCPHSNLHLVLAGPGNVSYDGIVDGVVDLGLVREEEKEALLANCIALFQPSHNESYSRVIMEAWFYSRPVAAHRECLATAIAVKSAHGGWLASTEAEWSELLAMMDDSQDDSLAEYGENGRNFARENADWNRVIDRYERVLETSIKPKTIKDQRLKNILAIHQLLASISYGDAISNYAIEVRHYLRSLSYKSDIFARHIDLSMAKEVEVFDPNAISDTAGIIYHHSIGSEVTSYAIQHPGPKCLIYHNITPGKFFEPYRPDFAALLEKGRSELKNLSNSFSLAAGDSMFNASELIQTGFENACVVPITISPQKWSHSADSGLMDFLNDGIANLLFAGRISPNKCQHHLVTAFFNYLSMDPDARLIIVGDFLPSDPYYAHVVDVINKHGLSNNVMLTGRVNDAELQAYYRTADLFWSMSEHEGFGIPLIEAMWFDVPVLAYKSSAVPETLGDAGIMFNSKEDLVGVAALAKLLIRDQESRSKVLTAQRKRRKDFLPESVWPTFEELIEKMNSQVL